LRQAIAFDRSRDREKPAPARARTDFEARASRSRTGRSPPKTCPRRFRYSSRRRARTPVRGFPTYTAR